MKYGPFRALNVFLMFVCGILATICGVLLFLTGITELLLAVLGLAVMSLIAGTNSILCDIAGYLEPKRLPSVPVAKRADPNAGPQQTAKL